MKYAIVDTQAVYRPESDRYEERTVSTLTDLHRALAKATELEREHFHESGFGRFAVRELTD